MAEYYEACPRCGRTNFGKILHCKRCGSEFCTKCIGKKTLPDGTKYECCPRCGAQFMLSLPKKKIYAINVKLLTKGKFY